MRALLVAAALLLLLAPHALAASCSTVGCFHGGACQASGNCTCAGPYDGQFCENKVNMCASAPCGAHGRCNDGLSSYTCACDSGFAGTTCTEMVGCPNCGTNGVCVNFGGAAKCSCACGRGGSTCSETVKAGNGNWNPPVLHVFEDVVFVSEDESVPLPIACSDPDAAPALRTDDLRIIFEQLPAYGRIIENSDGSYVYKPAPDFHGEDTLVVSCCDGAHKSVSRNMTIFTVAVDDPPVVDDLTLTTPAGKQLCGILVEVHDSEDDRSGIAIELAAQPAYGSLTPTDGLPGLYCYQPAEHFIGGDYFWYRAVVSGGRSAWGLGRVTVTGTPKAPEVHNRTFWINSTVAAPGNKFQGILPPVIDLLQHDGHTLELLASTQGAVELGADGVVQYTVSAAAPSGECVAWRAKNKANRSGQGRLCFFIGTQPSAMPSSFESTDGRIFAVDKVGDASSALRFSTYNLFSRSQTLTTLSKAGGEVVLAGSASRGSAMVQDFIDQTVLVVYTMYPFATNDATSALFDSLQLGRKRPDGAFDSELIRLTAAPQLLTRVPSIHIGKTVVRTPVTVALKGVDAATGSPSTLTYAIADSLPEATHRFFNFSSDGVFSFAPAAGFTGTATFTVTLTSQDGAVLPARPVELLVQPVNEPPTCSPLAATLGTGSVGYADLEGADKNGNGLTWSLVHEGTISYNEVELNPNGTIKATLQGSCAFFVRAFDGTAYSAPCEVRLFAAGATSNALSAPQIAGIIIGAVVVLAVIVCTMAILYVEKRNPGSLRRRYRRFRADWGLDKDDSKAKRQMMRSPTRPQIPLE